MARLICWALSIALHVAVPLLILGGMHLDFSKPSEVIELDLQAMVDRLDEYYNAPVAQAKPISALKQGGDYGGRNATEEALFKEFAEGGGIVGTVEYNEMTPKVRFGHFLFTRTYMDRSILGRYMTKDGMEVMILDGREDERLGKFVLYVPELKMVRTLTPMNDYIYTYGHDLLSEMPAEGSVMFLGDGDKIYSFLWIPEEGQAKYPKRVLFGQESDQ